METETQQPPVQAPQTPTAQNWPPTPNLTQTPPSTEQKPQPTLEDVLDMPKEPPTPTKKTNWPALFLTVLLIFALGGAGYFAFQNYQLKQKIAELSAQAEPTLLPTEIPTPSPTPDPTANWKTYAIETEAALGLTNYQIKLPSGWYRIEHSSNFQKVEVFQDTITNFIYKLTISQDKNLNPQTGKPYADLKELSGLPYEVDKKIVSGQPAAQVQPRAGSESNYKVLFFSKDSKLIFSIELDTPRDGTKVQEGKGLFDQILSTFKFTSITPAVTPLPSASPSTSPSASPSKAPSQPPSY